MALPDEFQELEAVTQRSVFQLKTFSKSLANRVIQRHCSLQVGTGAFTERRFRLAVSGQTTHSGSGWKINIGRR